MGASFSHVRGDNMTGYNKPGFHLGFGVSYPIGKKWDLSMTMGYSQKGSRRRYNEYGNPIGGANSWHVLRTDYLEVPFLLHFHVMEKWQLLGGLAGSRLITSYRGDFAGSGDVGTDFMRSYELSYHLGVSYNWKEDLNLYVRHATSIISVDNSEFSTLFSPYAIGLIHNVFMFGIEKTL